MDNDTVSAASAYPAMEEERVISRGANTEEPTKPKTLSETTRLLYVSSLRRELNS